LSDLLKRTLKGKVINDLGEARRGKKDMDNLCGLTKVDHCLDV